MADEQASAAAAAAAAAAGNGATGGNPPWYGTNADPVLVGHLQNRGWDKLEPTSAALAAAKAHSEAEKLIGGRAEDRVVWPKDAADAEGWNRVNGRLGVPSDTKEYDFSSVKFADGSPVDDEFANVLRAELPEGSCIEGRCAGFHEGSNRSC